MIGATSLEAIGDALVRNGLFNHVGIAKLGGTLLLGGALLLGYGTMLNLAPQPFERVVGLYIATLFCVWQIISFVAFGSVPLAGDPSGVARSSLPAASVVSFLVIGAAPRACLTGRRAALTPDEAERWRHVMGLHCYASGFDRRCTPGLSSG